MAFVDRPYRPSRLTLLNPPSRWKPQASRAAESSEHTPPGMAVRHRVESARTTEALGRGGGRREMSGEAMRKRVLCRLADIPVPGSKAFTLGEGDER